MLPGLAYTSLRDAILAHLTMAEALDALKCAASVRVITPAKTGKCYLSNSSAIERMEGARGKHGSERDVSTVWIEGNKLRTPITATRASHNREAHARVSDSSVISREGLYESP
jgi:hypothetical protein